MYNQTKKIMLKSGVMIASLFIFTHVSFSQKLKEGTWRGILQLNDSVQLPFNFNVKKIPPSVSDIFWIEIMNAEERIRVDEISFRADSVFIKMPVFDSEFKLKNYGDSLRGVWINYARVNKNSIPFSAKVNDSRRFLEPPTKPVEKEDRWKVIFSPNTKDEYFVIAEIKTESGMATGTFLTETGDYRYLEGYYAYGKLMLSCFDGAHAFLFSAKSSEKNLTGDFYSGSHWHEKWSGTLDDKFQLANPDSLTFVKPGFGKIDFTFKNTEGKEVSLSDAKFKTKVVIVQLMGSWCPNCMDETKFLSEIYPEYNEKGLEIVALAFEKATNFEKAKSNVERLKKRYNVQYEFLLTEKTGKDQASQALPMLNVVMSFPTTIYIDKKGRVRKIHTGFTGPGTGSHYQDFSDTTLLFLEKLLSE